MAVDDVVCDKCHIANQCTDECLELALFLLIAL